MAVIIKKSDIYPFDKVEERIQFYQERELDLIFSKAPEAKKIISAKLLLFWRNYKSKNFKNGK